MFLEFFIISFIIFTILGTEMILKSKTGLIDWLSLIFSIFSFIFGIFQIQHNERSVIHKYQYDKHFVGRQNEFERIKTFILSDYQNLCIVSGEKGIGKTLFLKEIADRINDDKKIFKRYCVLYVPFKDRNSVLVDVAAALNLPLNVSVAEICKKTKGISGKNWVFIIDNIQEKSKRNAIDFAKAVSSVNSLYKSIISISTDIHYNIIPSLFEKEEIQLLENSCHIYLEDIERERILKNSYGLPVYVRILLESWQNYKNSVINEDINEYLIQVIDQLDDITRQSLAIIVCLKNIENDFLDINTILGIYNEITEYTIRKLKNFSLIKLNNDIIELDDILLNSFLQILVGYYNFAYLKIYDFFKNKEGKEYIALFSLLLSDQRNIDFSFIEAVLKKELNNCSWFYLLRLGNYENNNRLNPGIKENIDVYTLFHFCYFKALLETGSYKEARKALDRVNNMQPNILGILYCNTPLQFEVQYYMADLEHLTNNFLDAADYIEALELKTQNMEQKLRCQYLRAHCLKHMGENLFEAENIFLNIASSTYNTDYQKWIRCIYSVASIHMFWNDLSFDYNKQFITIDRLAEKYSDIRHILLNANRHKAIWYLKIMKNPEESKRILEESLVILEQTQQRIKYDFYFQMGEWYREQYINSYISEYYNKGKDFYQMAIEFANEVGDYNLYSCSFLGSILLDICTSDKDIKKAEKDILIEIIEKTLLMKLNINYSYAMLIKIIIIDKTAVPENTILHWKKLRYFDLVQAAELYNRTNEINLPLTVM